MGMKTNKKLKFETQNGNEKRYRNFPLFLWPKFFPLYFENHKPFVDHTDSSLSLPYSLILVIRSLIFSRSLHLWAKGIIGKHSHSWLSLVKVRIISSISFWRGLILVIRCLLKQNDFLAMLEGSRGLILKRIYGIGETIRTILAFMFFRTAR